MTPADLVRFEWPRMEEIALHEVDGRRILAGWPGDASYRPLRDEEGLFERFARLGDDAEGFIAFARAYGDLDEARVPVAPLVEGSNVALGRPLEEWRAHRRILGFAVDLWDAVQGRPGRGPGGPRARGLRSSRGAGAVGLRAGAGAC